MELHPAGLNGGLVEKGTHRWEDHRREKTRGKEARKEGVAMSKGRRWGR